jgi:hypothetical protein
MSYLHPTHVQSSPRLNTPFTHVPQPSVQASQTQVPQTQQTLAIADIHLPAEVGLWPPAIGWWLLLALLIALFTAVCLGSYHVGRRYQQKWRYRRAALGLLKQRYRQWQQHNDSTSVGLGNESESEGKIDSEVNAKMGSGMTRQLEDNSDLGCATDMIAIVKRTAITAYSQDNAALFGQAWIDFLNQQTTTAYFSDSLAQWMIKQQYQAPSAPLVSTDTADTQKLDISQLYNACESWIKQHRVKRSATSAQVNTPVNNHVKSHESKTPVLGESA